MPFWLTTTKSATEVLRAGPLAIIPLLIMGVIGAHAPKAEAVAPAVVVGGIVVAASIPTALTQLEDWANWWSSSKLTPVQVAQVQKAVDYLQKRGFTAEAKQAQGMLNSSLLVYQKPPKGSTEDDTLAVTYGGLKNALFNDGHITLRGFFGATHDGPIDNLTDDQRTRLQAKTLLHELEHLNTQSNALSHPAVVDWVTDKELGPTAKHLGSLRQLGYDTNEITKIKDEYETNVKPQKLIDILTKELTKPSQPEVAKPDDEKEPQKTDDGNVTAKTAPGKPGPPPEGDKGSDKATGDYNPLNDPKVKDTGKPVNLGPEEGQKEQGIGGDQRPAQAVVPQPKDYGRTGDTPGEKTGQPPPVQPPYVLAPPNPPPAGPGFPTDPGRPGRGGTNEGGRKGGGGRTSKPPQKPASEAPCPPGLHREASEPDKGCH